MTLAPRLGAAQSREIRAAEEAAECLRRTPATRHLPFSSGGSWRSFGFATVIVTGVSSEIAQTLVTIGVDLTKDEDGRALQRGIEEIERLPGNQISRVSE
jgi:hypothetical protein